MSHGSTGLDVMYGHSGQPICRLNLDAHANGNDDDEDDDDDSDDKSDSDKGDEDDDDDGSRTKNPRQESVVHVDLNGDGVVDHVHVSFGLL